MEPTIAPVVALELLELLAAALPGVAGLGAGEGEGVGFEEGPVGAKVGAGVPGAGLGGAGAMQAKQIVSSGAVKLLPSGCVHEHIDAPAFE